MVTGVGFQEGVLDLRVSEWNALSVLETFEGWEQGVIKYIS